MFLNDKKSRNNSAEAANNADNSVINKEGWSVSFDRAVGAIAKYWKHDELCGMKSKSQGGFDC